MVMGLRRCGDGPPVEGVQFHPESFLTTEGPRLLANFLQLG
jgi:anthranilate/para-aminobenzoate synthase component II